VARPAPRGRGRLLLVDDEPAILGWATAWLRSLGYEVQSSTSGVRALELFLADPGRYDLVVTDQTMPKITGEVLAREMLRVRPGLPILLATGLTDQVDPERARQLGVRELLPKPLSTVQLAEAVQRALAGGPAVTDDQG
jgi:CheY-like chemotaxis protein